MSVQQILKDQLVRSGAFGGSAAKMNSVLEKGVEARPGDHR